MRRYSLRAFFFLFLSITLLTSCASKNENTIESRGTIAEIDGTVRTLSAAEVKTYCKNQYCEPNYVYYASFGKKQPSPPPSFPSPPPVSPPAPAPTPSPQPAPPGNSIPETLDYSRRILDVERAWTISKGSKEIIVAVVDTGVQVDHPDLAENIWVNQAEKNGKPGVDDDHNGYVDDVYGWDFANNRPNAIDDNQHGTHCAGIIGAGLNNIGIVGIAPQVKIMPVKFLASDGSGSTDAAVQAINYAVDNGAMVISNSWGGGGRSELLNTAIQRAIDRGVFVTAAAGNESSNNDQFASYPANYDRVISVASTDQNDAISSFSNFGKSVFIAAPGSKILSTIPNSNWATLSGTSMATPQVSGALALALSVRPNISVGDMKSLLCNSAKKILLNSVACGRMDVYALMQAVNKF